MSDLAAVQNRLDQHEREIALIGQSTKRMIDGQEQLTVELKNLTISLNRYIDRQDNSTATLSELKNKIESHDVAIAALRERNAENQPVINGVKSLNSKLVWFVLAAILTPIFSAGFIATRVGGG